MYENRKTRIACALLMVAALGYLGWHLLDDSHAPSEDVPAAGDRTDATSRREAPAVLRGAAPPPSSASPESSESPASTRVDAGAAKRARPVDLAPITGTVTVGSWPAREGTVRIVYPATGNRAGQYVTVESRIEESGRFVIPAPRPGALFLTVSVPGHQTRTVPVRTSPHPGDPIEIAFGQGRIFGVVRGAEGSPVAGAAVRLASYLMPKDEGYVPSAEGHVFRAAARTDPNGAYAFTDLPAGRYVVVAVPVPGQNDARNIRSFEVVIEDGESRRLDIGGVHYDPTWSGTVRYEDGSPVERAGNLFVKTEDGERRMYVNFDAKGRFGQAVPPGTYRIEFVFPGADMFRGMRLIQTRQTVTVLPTGAVEDVILYGARVTGRVNGTPRGIEPTSPGGPRGWPRSFCVVFTLEASEAKRPPSLIAAQPTRRVAVPLAKDGSFAVDGLCAGTWLVTGDPSPLTAEDGRPARLTITAGERTSALVLVHGMPVDGEGTSAR